MSVRVPEQHILWLQGTSISTTLRPKYILFGHMDPYTLNPKTYRTPIEPLSYPYKNPIIWAHGPLGQEPYGGLKVCCRFCAALSGTVGLCGEWWGFGPFMGLSAGISGS